MSAAEEVATYTLWLDILTFLLAVSTLGLWVVTWFGLIAQSRDTRRSLAVTRRAADAAKKSADIAEKALIDTERPYIFVVGVRDFKCQGASKPYVDFAVGNYGKTPAVIDFFEVGFTVNDQLILMNGTISTVMNSKKIQ